MIKDIRTIKTYLSRSTKDTENLGKMLSKKLKKGMVISLIGPLGAGKTVFVKGILKGLGAKEDIVRSPSFTLIREYRVKSNTIYHIDLYRIKDKKELFGLGYEEYFCLPSGISIVEWADKVEDLISEDIRIEIDFLKDTTRKLKFIFYETTRN